MPSIVAYLRQTSEKICDKNLLFGKKCRKNWPCVSSRLQFRPHDVVGATHWLELKAGARESAGAETVTGGLDLYQNCPLF